MKDLSEYLKETNCIDFSNLLIVQKVDALKSASSDKLDYIERGAGPPWPGSQTG